LKCFRNNWAVGSGTPEGSKLVNGHAYTVLNAYDLTLSNG